MSKLSDWKERVVEQREKFETLVAWHEQMHAETGIDLPYDSDATWISLEKTKRWLPEEQRYEHDLDAEREAMGLVYNAAKAFGATFTKDYSETDFEMELTIPGLFTGRSIQLSYSISREAVCTKRVVGYEDVPEYVRPAYRKEIVEWDCDSSLVKLGKDAAKPKAGE